MSDEIFFFSGKKADHTIFWGRIHWRLPRCCNYSNIISGSPTKVEKTDFLSFFLLLTEIPKYLCDDSDDMVIPGKFHPKKLYEKVKFWEKKIFNSRKASQVPSKNRKTTILGCRPLFFFFFLKKKLIIVFFGVKFTRDYRNVAIIPILCRGHRQKSRKPNFS